MKSSEDRIARYLSWLPTLAAKRIELNPPKVREPDQLRHRATNYS